MINVLELISTSEEEIDGQTSRNKYRKKILEALESDLYDACDELDIDEIVVGMTSNGVVVQSDNVAFVINVTMKDMLLFDAEQEISDYIRDEAIAEKNRQLKLENKKREQEAKEEKKRQKQNSIAQM